MGYAGRLVPAKGVADLVEAVALAQKQLPLCLSIAGDGPEAGPLAELAGRKLLPGTWELHDPLGANRLADWYRSLDLLVLPSRTTPGWKEQFGRVLGEAMACAVPVVGSTSGFIPEFVTGTGGGAVYSEGDVAELAETIDPGLPVVRVVREQAEVLRR